MHQWHVTFIAGAAFGWALAQASRWMWSVLGMWGGKRGLPCGHKFKELYFDNDPDESFYGLHCEGCDNTKWDRRTGGGER